MPSPDLVPFLMLDLMAEQRSVDWYGPTRTGFALGAALAPALLAR
jgi:hypothetical protein